MAGIRHIFELFSLFAPGSAASNSPLPRIVYTQMWGSKSRCSDDDAGWGDTTEMICSVRCT